MADEKRVTPEGVLNEYQRGQSYNSGIELAERVQRSEDFFIGDQWKGVNAPDLDKPVFNILKRVGNFFISNIVSDDIGISLEPFLRREELAGPAGPVGIDPGRDYAGGAGMYGMMDAAGAGTAGSGAEIWQAQQLGEQLPQLMKRQLDQAMELMNVKPMHRYFLRDALVDGDACFHFWFDPEADPQGYREMGGTPGVIRCELLDNTNVHFGNPQSQDVQSQPYLLLAFRVPVKKAQETARANGADGWENIGEDRDEEGINLDDEHGKTTVLRRYWKARAAKAETKNGQNGEEPLEGARPADEEHVFYCEVSAGGVEITPPTDTGLTLYPVVWMCWERVKNRFHGQSAVEGLLPNQIAINKLYAMAIQSVKLTAFPKIAYDKTKIGRYTNRVGEALGVTGDPTRAVAAVLQGANMSPQVTALLQDVISTTRDTMGASDAALGNINPDNTSAIIAVQRATSMPLELQKLDFYRVVEDEVRIWLDMMAAFYGVRPVEIDAPANMQEPGGLVGAAMPGLPAGMPDAARLGLPAGPAAEKPRTQRVLFAFSSLAGMAMRLNVEIGGASYWNELNEVSTADALFSKGIITSRVDYLERVPDGYIKDKAGLIESIEAQERQMREAQQMQAMMQMGGPAGMGAGAPAGLGTPSGPAPGGAI